LNHQSILACEDPVGEGNDTEKHDLQQNTTPTRIHATTYQSFRPDNFPPSLAHGGFGPQRAQGQPTLGSCGILFNFNGYSFNFFIIS